MGPFHGDWTLARFSISYALTTHRIPSGRSRRETADRRLKRVIRLTGSGRIQGLGRDSCRDSGTAGRRDSSGQTAVGQRQQQRSPSTTRQLLGAFCAHGWWPGPYRCNEHLLALLLGYLRPSTRAPKSVDRATIETGRPRAGVAACGWPWTQLVLCACWRGVAS